MIRIIDSGRIIGFTYQHEILSGSIMKCIFALLGTVIPFLFFLWKEAMWWVVGKRMSGWNMVLYWSINIIPVPA